MFTDADLARAVDRYTAARPARCPCCTERAPADRYATAAMVAMVHAPRFSEGDELCRECAQDLADDVAATLDADVPEMPWTLAWNPRASALVPAVGL